MKLRASLALMIALPALLSCSKDDSAPSPSIVGTWQEDNWAYSNCTDPNDVASYPCSLPNCSSITSFSSTGAFTHTFTRYYSGIGLLSGSDTGTYSISGNVLTMVFPSGGPTLTNTFSVTATKLTTVDATANAAGGTCTVTTNYSRQ